jgi:hypothetical protein
MRTATLNREGLRSMAYVDQAIDTEARRQRALDELGILDTPPDERIDRITRLAQDFFRVPMVSVTLLDHDRQWRKSQIGLGGDEAPRRNSFCDATVSGGRMLIVEDADVHPDFADNPFVTGDPHLKFYAGQPLEAPGGEHVGTLCILDTKPRALSDAERTVLAELAAWVQAEITRERELSHASVVQRALLPQTTPVIEGYTLAAVAVAAGQVMGDFYDWHLVDGRLRLTLADVMGKGIAAGIVAAGVRASLRTAPGRDLLASVAELDRLLSDDLRDVQMFVTALHADVEPATGRVDFVDAGHSLGYILRADDTWEPLRSTGMPLGMGLGDGRSAGQARLHRGDILMCCSDGLLDVLDPDDPFGHVRRELRAGGPGGAVTEAARLVGTAPAADDLTVVVVRRDA